MNTKIEVLVSTMRQKELLLHAQMNLQTDTIIINQTNGFDYQEIPWRDHLIRYYSFAEKGVGLSRNTALMRAKADICVLADDDMVFLDHYEKMVLDAFEQHQDADVIVFNLISKSEDAGRQNAKTVKLNLLNYMNYGAARIAFRRKAVTYRGISFNLNFGGGTQHQCGEDTLFLRDCLKAGLKLIAVPIAIAELHDLRPSTWFKGYSKEYFFDKGVVLALAHSVMAVPFCFYLALRHKEYANEHMSRKQVICHMLRGIRHIKHRHYR